MFYETILCVCTYMYNQIQTPHRSTLVCIWIQRAHTHTHTHTHSQFFTKTRTLTHHIKQTHFLYVILPHWLYQNCLSSWQNYTSLLHAISLNIFLTLPTIFQRFPEATHDEEVQVGEEAEVCNGHLHPFWVQVNQLNVKVGQVLYCLTQFFCTCVWPTNATLKHHKGDHLSDSYTSLHY